MTPPDRSEEVLAVVVELADHVLDELRERAEADELAPVEPERLIRYLVYLGAGYVEAEQVAAAVSCDSAYAALHRLHGAAEGQASVLLFHHAEAARGYAEEARAQAAHERMGGAYEALVERMEAEIAVREERIGKLEEALRR